MSLLEPHQISKSYGKGVPAARAFDTTTAHQTIE